MAVNQAMFTDTPNQEAKTLEKSNESGMKEMKLGIEGMIAEMIEPGCERSEMGLKASSPPAEAVNSPVAVKPTVGSVKRKSKADLLMRTGCLKSRDIIKQPLWL